MRTRYATPCIRLGSSLTPTLIRSVLAQLSPPISMQCPVCQQTRYSSDWKGSQWLAWSPVTIDFNCCRRCSPSGVHATWSELEAALDELRRRRVAVTELFHSKSGFDRFIEDLMDNVSARDRKELSYYGALVASPGGVRQQFDPGNWQYLQGMLLISPVLVARRGWNAETVGDIWEAILGYRYLYHADPDADAQLLAIADWAESYMNSVHVFVFLSTALSASFWGLSTAQWGVFVRNRGNCTVEPLSRWCRGGA